MTQSANNPNRNPGLLTGIGHNDLTYLSGRPHPAIAGMPQDFPAPGTAIQGIAGISGIGGLGGVRGYPYVGTGEPFMKPGYTRSPEMEKLCAMSTRTFLDYAAQKRKAAEGEGGATTLMALGLDSSSSMQTIKEIALAGFNKSLNEAKGWAPNVPGGVHVYQTFFSHVVSVSQEAIPAGEASLLNYQSYNPTGGTALFDAIGMTIERLLEHPAVWHGQTGVFLNIVTDGQELDSRYYDGPTLANLIDKLDATNNWTFALMATEGVETLAQLLKLRRGNVSSFNPHSRESSREAFCNVTGATQSYMATRSQGFTSANNLYAGRD